MNYSQRLDAEEVASLLSSAMFVIGDIRVMGNLSKEQSANLLLAHEVLLNHVNYFRGLADGESP